MKNILTGLAIAFIATMSCADKKENREEFKAEHNKDSLRNHLGDSATANSESTSPESDTPTALKDTASSPTNYKSTKPNTEVGGSR